jgi:hypothetical protein
MHPLLDAVARSRGESEQRDRGHDRRGEERGDEEKEEEEKRGDNAFVLR